MEKELKNAALFHHPSNYRYFDNQGTNEQSFNAKATSSLAYKIATN